MIAGFPFIASSFDPDARAFVQTSGATDRAALNFFVKGIKRLGLWDDMICWPLRSAQNAGTGSTAYSLGGLGAYNGTLVNGPTWGADGISFTGSSQSVSLPLISIASVISSSGGYSSFSVIDFISRSSVNSNFTNRINTKITGGQLFTDSNGENLRAAQASDTGERFTTQNLVTGSFVGSGFKTSFGCLKTDSTGFSIFNDQPSSSSISTFGSAPIPPPFVDGTAGQLMGFIGSPWAGNVDSAFFAFWSVPTTAQQAIDIRSLYVKTIGAGLGL